MVYAQNLRIPTIFLISILLVGCGVFGTKLEVDATITEVPRAPLVLPEVDVLQLDTVKWQESLTEENFQKVLKEVEGQGFDPVLFGMTDEDYESMAINQAKTFKLIMQQRAVIKALKDYYMNEEAKDGDDRTDE
jgi:hypothetical protein